MMEERSTNLIFGIQRYYNAKEKENYIQQKIEIEDGKNILNKKSRRIRYV